MTLKSCSFILAVSLVAMPVAGALAQGNNPAGNYGSNQSTTAAPGTADSKTMSGMHTGDTTAHTSGTAPGAMNSTKPGATGKTVVPGSTSSIAGAASNTAEQKTGVTSAGAGGGGK